MEGDTVAELTTKFSSLYQGSLWLQYPAERNYSLRCILGDNIIITLVSCIIALMNLVQISHKNTVSRKMWKDSMAHACTLNNIVCTCISDQHPYTWPHFKYVAKAMSGGEYQHLHVHVHCSCFYDYCINFFHVCIHVMIVYTCTFLQAWSNILPRLLSKVHTCTLCIHV